VRFVDRFKALVFDMNGTFMFGHDRLGEDEDFFATYKRLGGNGLDEARLRAAVIQTCAQLRRDYNNPAYFESFPPLLDAVIAYTKLNEPESKNVASVIAEHEVGTVPDWAAESLLILSNTHPLALVSNVWAPAHHWSAELDRSGAASAFKHFVFSSTLRAIKPSPLPFLTALQALGFAAEDTLFIGDSVERDMLPAKRLGMRTALISRDASIGQADITVPSICHFVQ
jgi:FMN phosphatase YigB (HAD superfamily)